MREVETEFAAFADQKDATGNPLRPHFAEVRPAMGEIITLHPETDIATAYENAVWANPKLREANLARQRTVPASRSAKPSKPKRSPRNGVFQAARARARRYRNTATFITKIYPIAAPIGNLFNSI